MKGIRGMEGMKGVEIDETDDGDKRNDIDGPVSYTHLTLPTKA